MEKEESQKNTNLNENKEPEKENGSNENLQSEDNQEINQESGEKTKDLSPEEKITELEDKVARTFAEMENQRRRFEKEKLDAFEYGGYSFAKEALNLIDNLDRSKHVLESDEKLKETEDKLKSKYECSICMENTREYACVPCGHTYCEECCRKMTNGQCYTCRKRVDFFQKLF